MSEKDQEQFMKDTPVEGAPQFDVAAPAFVPKEEAEDLVVPEASGLPTGEGGACGIGVSGTGTVCGPTGSAAIF